ncbi:Zn-ribbon domain-containing OB-fold protein [Mycolicibacterium vinylchloridicum]|uniref:Zn-ribbon domain-containing OB-fold protein n=1 Tax=Mycolicibacterium vinylchloridicum TaxID=2736928 RepID=UPI0015C7B061|nr:OB-fold domain-containing protein [Mycolicibacterium vinylchloridicum]
MTAEASEDVFDRFATEWIDRDNVEFYRGLLRRQLLVNRCADCAKWYQPPWPTCPNCWSASVTPTAVSGRGVVHTFTVAPRAEHALAVISLAEQDDLRASGLVVGVAPGDVTIGMAVELEWLDRCGNPVPAFKPV